MLRISAILTALVFTSPALAAEVGGTGGFASGFLHPILGFDHLLAMIAVGLLSVQIGGRAIWTVPLAFVLFLGFGGALGLVGMPLPEVEGAISISVLALGLAIAFQTRLPLWLAMAFVGFFAIFHGHAHGEEIPTLADPWTYVAGFMLASALLHLTGVGLGPAQRPAAAEGAF
ncbi:MAG: HupE/UreJ family protein, partial [Rhizobiales bacterium]|nr:HupE/UreJ family protein [Hyphomicrobiales bacterium]